MNNLKFGITVTLAAGLLSGVAMAETRLTVAATGQSSSFYAYHTAVAQVLSEVDPELSVTVMESGGSEENLRLISDGIAQWGQFNEPQLFSNYAGLDGIEPNDQLRFLAPVVDVAFFNVVNADMGIEGFSGLAGQSYGPGSSGSSTALITSEIIASLGYDVNMVAGSYGDLVAAMKDRRIAGFTKAGTLTAEDSAILDVRSSVPIRIIGLTDEELSLAQAANPNSLFSTFDETVYGDGPVTLAKVVLVLGTDSTLPEDVGYRVYRALVENNERIAEIYHPLSGVDIIAATLDSAKTPLHAGVVRYLREQGVDIPEGLVPPESQ